MTASRDVASVPERPPIPALALRLAVTDTDTGAGERRARDWQQLQNDLESMSGELAHDLASIAGEDAGALSLCEGWTVRDVLLHLAAGDQQATESLRTIFGRSPTARRKAAPEAIDVDARSPLSMLLDRLAEGRRKLLAVAADIPPAQVSANVPWVAGEITAFALMQARLMETWIHGWDVRWPLHMAQPYDDRCWWLADIAVRHVPYALRLAAVPTVSIDLQVQLGGTGGGTWNRGIGQPPSHSVSIRGPAWAWVTWAARRVPGQVSAQHLTYASDDLTSLVVQTARSFA